jgi:hypothetical protein
MALAKKEAKKRQLDTARKLKASNVPLDTIISACELSPEEVKKL